MTLIALCVFRTWVLTLRYSWFRQQNDPLKSRRDTDHCHLGSAFVAELRLPVLTPWDIGLAADRRVKLAAFVLSDAVELAEFRSWEPAVRSQ